MKLELVFAAIVLFASGLFAGCACGYYLIPRAVVSPPRDLRHRAVHVRPVNPVFEPLFEEERPHPKITAHGL